MLIDSLEALAIPLGWNTPDSVQKRIAAGGWPFKTPGRWLGYYFPRAIEHLPGLLITILALSLGAPFWFDMLNKVINIRAAGRAPEERPKPPEALPPPRGA